MKRAQYNKLRNLALELHALAAGAVRDCSYRVRDWPGPNRAALDRLDEAQTLLEGELNPLLTQGDS